MNTSITTPKKVKPEWIGFLPFTHRFHQQVFSSFEKAGFANVRVQINRDLALATYWLKKGKRTTFKNPKQAHAAIFRLLRDNGVRVKGEDLTVWVVGDTITGAFTPPQYDILGY